MTPLQPRSPFLCSVTWLAETLSMARRPRCRNGLDSINCVLFLHNLADLTSLIFLALVRKPQLQTGVRAKVIIGGNPVTGAYDESKPFGIDVNPLVHLRTRRYSQTVRTSHYQNHRKWLDAQRSANEGEC